MLKTEFFANCGRRVSDRSCTDALTALVSRLRRARSASRSKPSRAAVGGSRKLVGRADESETGSANFYGPILVRGQRARIVRGRRRGLRTSRTGCRRPRLHSRRVLPPAPTERRQGRLGLLLGLRLLPLHLDRTARRSASARAARSSSPRSRAARSSSSSASSARAARAGRGARRQRPVPPGGDRRTARSGAAVRALPRSRGGASRRRSAGRSSSSRAQSRRILVSARVCGSAAVMHRISACRTGPGDPSRE